MTSTYLQYYFSLIVDEIESDTDKAGSCILRRVVSLLHCPFMKNNCRINRTFGCHNFNCTFPCLSGLKCGLLGVVVIGIPCL